MVALNIDWPLIVLFIAVLCLGFTATLSAQTACGGKPDPSLSEAKLILSVVGLFAMIGWSLMA